MGLYTGPLKIEGEKNSKLVSFLSQETLSSLTCRPEWMGYSPVRRAALEGVLTQETTLIFFEKTTI